MTGLALAVACGRAEVAEQLILRDNRSEMPDTECLVNLGDVNGRRPLHWAAAVGSYACAKHIIGLSTRVYMRAKDEKGDTALHCACNEGDEKMVSLLLEGRKLSTHHMLLRLVHEINKEGETAAMLASRMGQTPCAQIVVEREAALEESWGVSSAMPPPRPLYAGTAYNNIAHYVRRNSRCPTR